MSNKPSTSNYKKWTEDLVILKSLRKQMEKNTDNAAEILRTLLTGRWDLDVIKLSGVILTLKIMSKSKNEQIAKLSMDVLAKFKAQSVKEDQTKIKKKGFQPEFVGKIDLDETQQGRLVLKGTLINKKEFQIYINENGTVSTILDTLRKQVGLFQRNTRVEFDGVQLKSGIRLSSYDPKYGQQFVIYSNL